VEVSEEHFKNIVDYQKKYEAFLKTHNNTANKEVWKIYDHITDDMFHELLG